MLSLSSGRLPTLVRRTPALVLACIGVLWLVIRFIGLERAPRGFWMDESWDATHAMCLAETGSDADGKPWPLFSGALAGGTLPITWTGPLAIWTRIFGTSIQSFRTPSALWVVLTCAALFAIARGLLRLSSGSVEGRLFGPNTDAFPWLVLFAALVSPWSFQFSRIAWEGPVAPGFLVLALWAMARARLTGNALWAVLCGAFGGASMISYPPLRAAVPLILTASGFILFAATPVGKARERFSLHLAFAAVTLCLAFSPVVLMIVRGEGTERMMSVSIFSPEWIEKNRGNIAPIPFFFSTLLDHLLLQLRPSYLFFTGDANLRHSSHLVGQLSPVDVLAVFVALGAIARLAGLVGRQVFGRDPRWPRIDAREQMLVILALYCVVAGMFGALPAALTWESVPHALRSIGAWPFVALFSGAVLAMAWSRRAWFPWVVAAVAVVYSGIFLPRYFEIYKRVDPDVFHRDVVEAIEKGRSAHPARSVAESLQPLVPRYGDYVLRYFLMNDGGMSCRDSERTLSQMRRSR